MTDETPSDNAEQEVEKSAPTGGQIKRARLTSDEIADEAQRIIDEAIRRNVPHEIVIVVILASVAIVGISLLLSGSATLRWELLASGSACAFAVSWPVTHLVAMWKFNLAIKILPAVIRMSDTKSRQELILRLVDQLIGLLKKD